MNKLWIFGDSFSARWNSKWTWTQDYILYKGYKPKQFFNIISEKYNLSIENKSIGGCDNYTIFQTICDNIDSIGENDVVIIGWTETLRLRIANPKYDIWHRDKWIYLLPNLDNPKNMYDYISEPTYNEMMLIRTSEIYREEVKSWIKMIKKSLPNNKIIFWSWCKYPNDDFKPTSIKKETSDKIMDGHYGEIGHKMVSDWMIELLETDELHIDKYFKK